jgi:hypothetical protein
LNPKEFLNILTIVPSVSFCPRPLQTHEVSAVVVFTLVHFPWLTAPPSFVSGTSDTIPAYALLILLSSVVQTDDVLLIASAAAIISTF